MIALNGISRYEAIGCGVCVVGQIPEGLKWHQANPRSQSQCWPGGRQSAMTHWGHDGDYFVENPPNFPWESDSNKHCKCMTCVPCCPIIIDHKKAMDQAMAEWYRLQEAISRTNGDPHLRFPTPLALDEATFPSVQKASIGAWLL